MKRFWAAFGVIAMIAVFLALPRADAAPAACFVAVNDRLLPLSRDTVPLVEEGVVYAPYPVFESRELETISAVWTQTSLELRAQQKSLTFDLVNSTAYDERGNQRPVQAIADAEMVYVPTQYVCQYFSLDCTMFITEYGTVARLKNADAEYSDSAFLEAISSQLALYYQTYTANPTLPLESLPVASELTDPTDATQSPLPSDDVETPLPSDDAEPTSEISQEPAASEPVSPSPSPSVSPSPNTVQSLRLGVYVTDETAAKACLDWCDARSQSVCLFFAPGMLTTQGDLVRRAVGSGYEIGLYLAAGESPQDTLEEGNRVLSTVARTTTFLVTASHLNDRQAAALEESGYVLFRTDGVIGENGIAAVDQAFLGEAEEPYLLFQDTAAVNSVFTTQTWGRVAEHLERFTGTN